MDKIKFHNLLRKAKLSGLKISGLLAQWEQAKITENEVAEELATRLDKVYKAMFKQREFVMAQRSRQISTSRDGYFKTELPPGSKKPKSKIVLCDFCQTEVALLKDLKNTYIPLKTGDFEPLSDRDSFPPFHPASVWPHINCRTCGFRVGTERDKVLLSDGYLIINEKVEKMEEQDVQTETVETSQPES